MSTLATYRSTYQSTQDFAATMARGWALLARCTTDEAKRNTYQEYFERDLHEAMGWRQEHLEVNDF